MNAYLWLKCLHIVSSVLLVGTGLGTAFYMLFTNRSQVVAAQAVVTRLVVRADWWFTTPAVIVQPVSGLLLAHWAGYALTTPWLVLAMALYALAGVCWLPVVWLQIRMAKMAAHAYATGQPLPAQYAVYALWWERLGYPAFMAMAVVFYLMVVKPSLWG